MKSNKELEMKKIKILSQVILIVIVPGSLILVGYRFIKKKIKTIDKKE